jgi:hypothetical protein
MASWIRIRGFLMRVGLAVPSILFATTIFAKPALSTDLALSSRSAPIPGLLNALRPQITAGRCHAAAKAAELRLGLPPGILVAIGRVESGRPDLRTHRPEPWPWTVQALGKGQFFETKAEAITWVKQAEARGLTSIDVGCLQVNLLYHPSAFANLDEAFDPDRNADYAGRFLRRLYAETGDWRQATGLYHSRTATIALRYQGRVGHALRAEVSALPSSGNINILIQLSDAWRSTLPASGSSRSRFR